MIEGKIITFLPEDKKKGTDGKGIYDYKINSSEIFYKSEFVQYVDENGKTTILKNRYGANGVVKKESKMIYIAAPYSHIDKDVINFRVKKVCEYSAELLKNKQSCISPITTGTGILAQTELPTDFEFWQHLSYDLIDVCGEIHVLMLDEWEESKGVKAEIEYATKKGLKIKYV